MYDNKISNTNTNKKCNIYLKLKFLIQIYI